MGFYDWQLKVGFASGLADYGGPKEVPRTISLSLSYFPLSWLHLIQDFPSQWEDGSEQLQSLHSLSIEYNREEQKSVALKSW